MTPHRDSFKNIQGSLPAFQEAFRKEVFQEALQGALEKAYQKPLQEVLQVLSGASIPPALWRQLVGQISLEGKSTGSPF